MSSFYSPVVIFAYNRLDHLKQTISALEKNVGAEYTEVCVRIDGFKNQEDLEVQTRIKDFLSEKINSTKFKALSFICSETNKGLASSIINGVSESLDKSETIIVLEDDMVTSKYFLRFMNDGLSMYSDNDEVASIHGYSYPLIEDLPETFFLKGADCWGWSTWRRAWSHFEEDGSKLYKQLKDRDLLKEFNFGNTYDYCGMLTKQISGRNDSWAIRWYASTFLKNMVTLYPASTMVVNIGIDGSGTHCGESDEFESELNQNPITTFPESISPNGDAFKAFSNFFRSQTSTPVTLKKKIKSKVKRLFNVFS